MLGVIAGDIIGSVYEHHPTKSTRIRMRHPHSRYTDDTVLTCATAHAILTGLPYEAAYREFGRRHPDAGYGGSFIQWLWSPNPAPYNSWGNGSAMRVAPVGWAFDSIDAVLAEAAKSAMVTHGDAEGGDPRGDRRALRVRSRLHGGRDPSGVPLRRVVPGVGAGGVLWSGRGVDDGEVDGGFAGGSDCVRGWDEEVADRVCLLPSARQSTERARPRCVARAFLCTFTEPSSSRRLSAPRTPAFSASAQ